MSGGLEQSVHSRLIRHAHRYNLDPNLVLARYGAERLLYRLAQSPHAERFVLKGGLMLVVWLGEGTRATRDADLLGLGNMSADELRRIFGEVITTAVQPDGLIFDADAIEIAAIRREDAYGGQRVTLRALLGPARLRVQVDVGAGDALTPAPTWLDYPSLLNLPRPRLRAYRPESAIAEKLHAMVELGSRNSRMRDYFDLHALAMRHAFRGSMLAGAIRATFLRRNTGVPAHMPLGMTEAFTLEAGKDAQWTAFVRRSRLTTAPESLSAAIKVVSAFAFPPLAALAQSQSFTRHWLPGGPWLDGDDVDDSAL